MKAECVLIFAITVMLFFNAAGPGFFSERLAGQDLIGNYALLEEYEKSLREGDVFVRSENFSAGIRLSLYPPLFFVISLLVSKLSLGLISIDLSYRLMVTFSVAAFPCAVYIFSRRSGFGNEKSVLVSFSSMLFVFAYGIQTAFFQTVNYGLVAQMLALNFCILMLGELIGKRWKSSGILLGLVVLTNVYVAALSFLSIAIYLILNFSQRMNIIRSLSISFAVSFIWLIPVLSRAGTIGKFGYPSVPLARFPPIFLAFPLLLLSLDKKTIFIFLVFVSSLALDVLDISFIQGDRFFLYSEMFASVLFGISLGNLVSMKMLKGAKKIAAPALAMAMISACFFADFPQGWKSDIDTTELENYLNETRAEARVLAEASLIMGSDRYTLAERLGMAGIPVMNSLHSDLTPNGRYAFYMQYSFSRSPKKRGLCDICDYAEFDAELLSLQMKRYNVKRLISANDETDHRLESFMEFEKEIDQFSVFVTSEDYGYIEIPKYMPVNVIGSYAQWKEFNGIAFRDKELMNLVFVWNCDIGKGLLGKTLSLSPNRYSKGVISISENETIKDFIGRVKPLIFESVAYEGSIESFSYADGNISIEADGRFPALIKFAPDSSGSNFCIASPYLMLAEINGRTELYTGPSWP